MSEIPLRSGSYGPLEAEAKRLAGGFGDNEQPWIPPVKTPIDYPPRKNRQTRIPLEFDWSTLGSLEKVSAGCYRWKPKRKQEPKPMGPWAPPIPDPEGHRLPDGSVINAMTFDDKPWLDSAPIDVQAKAGYTNFSNDLAALVNASENGLFRVDERGRWYRDGWGPGDYWARVDREQRKAGVPKPATEDASNPPPRNLIDSLASLRGRQCRNCLVRLPEEARGKTRHCSDRCRDRGKYTRRRGESGTIRPGVELSGYAVDRKRVGIDTGDVAFHRLLSSVA
ncbi:MAG: hypothetical protein WBH51_01930 [Mycolicibacter algericus]|uniref:hypothetical protein n=1 Tax=Mycolicibacter algericus TaxID=1288388 RepID=UPI003C760701